MQDCIAGKLSKSEAARKAGVDEKSLRRWIARYEVEGSLAFIATGKNRIYSEETKLTAVQEYLSGCRSVQKLCKNTKFVQRSSSGIGFRCIIAAETSNTK
ncbi:MAG: transposase [Clostridia bacterium]|nr:transposase [Clostridia bacterium]